MTIDLTGRAVLVTGAGRGIGHAIAARLLESGASVALHYLASSEGVDGLAGRFADTAFPVQADLETREGPRRLFEQAVGALGRLDGLVNNAGIAEATPPDMDDEAWRRVFDRTMAVNLAASTHLSRLSIAAFRQGGGGRIVSVASRAAFRGDTADFMDYAASKAGMVAHARSVARAFGKDGICAFVIAPGWVNTDMAADAAARYGEAVLMDGALSRITESSDLAPLVALLLSGMADHATGTTIHVNAASYIA